MRSLPRCVVVLLASVLLAARTPAQRTFLVTNTFDDGRGSLRQALAEANEVAGRDRIHFAIEAPGPHTIRPITMLPSILDPVVIDGYTQAGASPNTNPAGSGLGSNAVLMIELEGTLLGSSGDALQVEANDVEIRGLALSEFPNGIHVVEPFENTVIAGCFIGTDVTGTVGGSITGGVAVFGPSTRIGGTDPADRNVISGANNGILISGAGGSGVLIQGNLIGTDASGTVAIPNFTGIRSFFLSSDVQIGGSDPSAGNVISGNTDFGVNLLSEDNRVEGNRIGTDVTGTASLPNGRGGVWLQFGNGHRVGGPGSARNVFAPQPIGIELSDSTTGTVVQNNRIGADLSGSTETAGGIGIVARGPGRIGGLAPGLGNVVSGHDIGIQVLTTGDVAILGNRIGSDATGTVPFPNRVGIEISARNTLVLGNRIAFNTEGGIRVPGSKHNRISRNSIDGNGRLGIDLGVLPGVTLNDPGDLDTGANDKQNFPVLEFAFESGSAVLVGGFLSSQPASEYVIELFASPACGPGGYGQGETFLAEQHLTTDGRGFAAFTFVVPRPLTGVVTATATDAADNTSEFSRCRTVLPLRRR